jgi:CBS domain-containing protein
MIVAGLMSHTTISVLPETMLADAARMMLANHVSGLPVLDAQGRLVGILTEGDLLQRTELGTDGEPAGWLKAFLLPSSVAADYVLTHGRHVSGVMTHNPVFVTPDTQLSEVAQMMIHKRIKRLPVMQDGRLVGVVSRSDLLRVLARKLIETPEAMSDGAIGAYIRDELAHARWAPRNGLNVAVKERVVTLTGTIFSDEERRGIVVIAENAPGVKEVLDQLIYVDPGSGMAFPAGA